MLRTTGRALFAVLLLAGCTVHSAAAGSFVGCFSDEVIEVLPTRALLTVQLTPAACSSAASARGLTVYGLKGNECWIGVFCFMLFYNFSRHSIG